MQTVDSRLMCVEVFCACLFVCLEVVPVVVGGHQHTSLEMMKSPVSGCGHRSARSP